MRRFAILAGLMVAAGAAFGQPAPQGAPSGPTPPPPEMNGTTPPGADQAAPPGPQGQALARPRVTPRDRFAAANVTHDGRLTLQQAQAAGWRPVANHFGEIDRDRKGYVTLQDLHEWFQARRAARAGQTAPPLAQGGQPPY